MFVKQTHSLGLPGHDKNLFISDIPPEVIQRYLNVADLQILTKSLWYIMEGKFFEAVLNVKNDKTPGPENFSSEFCHLFKEVLVGSLEGMLMLFCYRRNFCGL